MTRAPRIRAVLRVGSAAAILLAMAALMADGDRLWRWAVGLPVGDELLYLSAATGDVDGVRRALREGAWPDAPSANEIPAIAIAASAGKPAIVALLLENGASATGSFGGGMTPLSYAASTSCDPASIRMLLDAGADPNAGWPLPPLVTAAQHGSVEVVQVLLEHGADPDIRGRGTNTWSPMEAAQEFRHDEVAALIRRARARLNGPGRSFPA